VRVTGWLTFLIDLSSMIASFYLAAFIGGAILYSGGVIDIYINVFIVLLLFMVAVTNTTDNRNIYKRGYLEEFISIIRIREDGTYSIWLYSLLVIAK
jgi:hypothetical protein